MTQVRPLMIASALTDLAYKTVVNKKAANIEKYLMPYISLRWSHIVGQFGSEVKVYSDVWSCRQILFQIDIIL